MNYNMLIIWVEGDDDVRFFEAVIRPLMERNYDHIGILKYRNQTKDKLNDFLTSIESMGADYLIVCDIDNSPCITSRKQKLQELFPRAALDRIRVVSREIESWYMAGLDPNACRALKIGYDPNSHTHTKEQCVAHIKPRFSSKVDFMIEALKHYSVSHGVRRNESLRYFLQKAQLAV